MAAYDTWVISAVIIIACVLISAAFVIYNKIKERKTENIENDLENQEK